MNFDVLVPNQPPAVDPGAVRLAVCAESPAVEEVSWCICHNGHGFALDHWSNKQLARRDRCVWCGSQRFEPCPTPMVGESGRLLNDLLKAAGLPRERVLVANVSRRPLAEHEKTIDYVRPLLPRLAIDLEAFAPNCVLVLGNLALRSFLGDGHLVSNWRGSIFEGELDSMRVKVVAALHPAAILREPSQLALLREDVKRAVAEAASPALALPVRTMYQPQNADEACALLQAIRDARQPVGFDIEGYATSGITVLSFATTSTAALSVPLRGLDWSHLWSDSDEARLLRAVGDVLEDEVVCKVAHSGAYEAFVHRWLHGHRLRNLEDTMFAWHTLYPELLKDLSVVASLLTRGAYWGSSTDWGVYGREPVQADRDFYNAQDSMRTLECWQAMQPLFSDAQRGYYQHQIALLEPCLEMMHEGMSYDVAARDAMVAQIQAEVYEAQGSLDQLAGIAPPSFREVVEAVAFKKAWDKCSTWESILEHAKPTMRAAL